MCLLFLPPGWRWRGHPLLDDFEKGKVSLQRVVIELTIITAVVYAAVILYDYLRDDGSGEIDIRISHSETTEKLSVPVRPLFG